MANRRMLARNVAMSRKLSLISFAAEALYHRGLPFTDDNGVMVADLEEYRATVIPMGKNGRRISLAKLESILRELGDIELIYFCDRCKKKVCLQYNNFSSFQTMKTDRKLKTDCLDSKGFQRIPMDSLNLTKPNLTKPNNQP